MTNRKFKIPLNEATGKKPLDGVYKISFDISVTPEDEILVTDIIQAIAEGFDGHSVIQKIAHVDVEKLNKQSPHGTSLKVGDVVRIVDDVQLKTEILDDNDFYIIGKAKSTMRSLGEMNVTILKNSTAVVNKITKDAVELIDFDCSVVVPLQDEETDELENTHVNLECVDLPLYNVEKLEEGI